MVYSHCNGKIMELDWTSDEANNQNEFCFAAGICWNAHATQNRLGYAFAQNNANWCIINEYHWVGYGTMMYRCTISISKAQDFYAEVHPRWKCSPEPRWEPRERGGSRSGQAGWASTTLALARGARWSRILPTTWYPLVMTNIANWKITIFCMGTLTISMAIVHGYVKLPEGSVYRMRVEV